MQLFPTLSCFPDVRNFKHSSMFHAVRQVQFECKALLTRPLFTDIPVRRNVYYPLMPNEDKEILELWEKNDIEFGGKEFQWKNPKNEKTYTTLLSSPIDYNLLSESDQNFWKISIDLITLRESFFLGLSEGISNIFGTLV